MSHKKATLAVWIVLASSVANAEAETVTINWPEYEVALPRFDTLDGTRILQSATVDVEISGLTFFAFQTPGVPHTHAIDISAGPMAITGVTSQESQAGSHRHGLSAAGSHTFTGGELDLFLGGPSFLPFSSDVSDPSNFLGHNHRHRLPGRGFRSVSRVTFLFTVVPEPGSAIPFAIGVLTLLFTRRSPATRHSQTD